MYQNGEHIHLSPFFYQNPWEASIKKTLKIVFKRDSVGTILFLPSSNNQREPKNIINGHEFFTNFSYD